MNFVIRPPRAEYDPSRDLLQPQFVFKGRQYQREDLKISNSQGHVLQCSHYMPVPMLEERPLPCVIYCHGNSGCRADATEAAVLLLPSNITVFTLDFSGSGLSEGEYVTLGWNEMNDLKDVVAHLREDKRISCIGLWGRSMGAVTSLMYGAQDPSIAGMVLDSPFSNLVDLMMELVDVYKIRLPKFTLKVAIQYMRKVIQKKAHFDIFNLDAVQVAKKSFIPALFGHATEDLFIQPHHSDVIYKAYVGDKNIIKFEGDHNSSRPQFYYDSIAIFFHNILHPPDEPTACLASRTAYDAEDLGFNDNVFDENVWFEVLRAMHPSQINANNSPVPPHTEELGAESAENAIGEPQSRWQMSRIEFPTNLEESEEDISRLLTKGNFQGDASEASSSYLLQRQDNGGLFEDTFLGQCNGTNDDSWAHEFPREMNMLAAATSKNTFAQFPSTADDEERMIMEAITLSLQEVRVTDSEPLDLSASHQTNGEGVHTAVPSQVPVIPVLQDQPPITDHVTSLEGVEHIQREVQSSTSGTQTIGTLEALGQRLGIGLFRAMGNRQMDSS